MLQSLKPRVPTLLRALSHTFEGTASHTFARFVHAFARAVLFVLNPFSFPLEIITAICAPLSVFAVLLYGTDFLVSSLIPVSFEGVTTLGALSVLFVVHHFVQLNYDILVNFST